MIFLQKEATVSLLFITSSMLFQSILPLKHMDFMPNATVDVFGSKTVSFILRLYLIASDEGARLLKGSSQVSVMSTHMFIVLFCYV